jgi:hypothetical protein
MHLLVPFASAPDQAPPQVLQGLQLPRLQRLLGRLAAGSGTRLEATSLNLPHEHVLAACRGWGLDDGHLPLAAWQAQADGIAAAPGELGWALLTPSHWQVGSDGIVLLDPTALQLGEDESRALWRPLCELFESEGWALHWGAPLRWYAAHASLADLASASLDRVVGRGIDQWLPDRRAGRTVRRLQSEAQMLLYTHPVNAAREARGELAVNSFWLSGTGRTQPPAGNAHEPLLDARLRDPWLAGDGAAWAQAWAHLDAHRLGELDARAARGEPISLTLCGERLAQRFDTVRRGAWQRLTLPWRQVCAAKVLEAL